MTAGMIAEAGNLRMNSDERLNFISAAVAHKPAKGYILEFGVGKGVSLRLIAQEVNPLRVYGFDSFEGLPENWQFNDHLIFAKGSFKYDPPKLRESNVRLVRGWFSDTLPEWKEEHHADISFLHIDVDLYSSCKTVLTELNHQIVPGTILLFDELLNYPRWEEGEWKAFTEWQEEYDREVEQLGTNWTQASYRVIK